MTGFLGKLCLAIVGCCWLSGPLALAYESVGSGNCFQTGGSQPLTVCHNPGDEGVFYPTPPLEVAYNAQIIKFDDSNYQTIYHSESRDSRDRNVARPGDSIRVGLQSGPFSYQMASPTEWALWGTTTDIYSTLYYGIGVPNQNAGGASGGGNPMVVVGNRAAGDPYTYMFFLAVSDGFQYNANDWRHYLSEARTVDFKSWDVLSVDPNGNKSWQPFTNASADWQRRPVALADTNGNAIASNFTADINSTQGLIGSISYTNGVYYFFYTDRNPANENEFQLYVRTTSDVSQGEWSPATQITNSGMPIGAIMRVQKAKGMNRWSVVYSCYSLQTGGQDICVQYTGSLNLTGPDSLASLTYFLDETGHAPFYLGLSLSNCPALGARGQHDLMTDLNGNLESPNGEADLSRGGILTWMDACANGPYGAPMFRAGWDVK
jgi:hypothetical protein